MKYSLVNGVKVEAFPKGKGLCICCNRDTIAKCGTVNVNHWSHRNLVECDSWWESETEWHRKWKARFPELWQEVIHVDPVSNERHIADVKTDKGVVIELQNSPMSSAELHSREQFYKNMVWIVNGLNFTRQFEFFNKLPDPKSEFAKDIQFRQAKGIKVNGFFRHSDKGSCQYHSMQRIEKEIEKYYIGHHAYSWKKPRTVWYEATCKVFIDFGLDDLWELVNYDSYGFKAVKRISKAYFIERALGKSK